MSEDIDRVKKLGTRERFIDTFWSECSNDETYTDTFNKLNDEYERTFGKPRYSDYNSFQTSVNRKRSKDI